MWRVTQYEKGVERISTTFDKHWQARLWAWLFTGRGIGGGRFTCIVTEEED